MKLQKIKINGVAPLAAAAPFAAAPLAAAGVGADAGVCVGVGTGVGAGVGGGADVLSWSLRFFSYCQKYTVFEISLVIECFW